MFGYSYRLRVILLSLGVVLGYGGAIAHLAWHRHHGYHGQPWHDCYQSDGSWDAAPWNGGGDKPASHGAPAPKPVQ